MLLCSSHKTTNIIFRKRDSNKRAWSRATSRTYFFIHFKGHFYRGVSELFHFGYDFLRILHIERSANGEIVV